MKKYWDKDTKALWDKWKDAPKESLIKEIMEIVLEDASYQETFTIVEALKKQMGMKYNLPGAYTKKYLIECGMPDNEMIEAKV